MEKEGVGNCEWLETGLRTALFADARGIIETMLADPKLPVADSQKRPGEKSGGLQEKTMQSLFGPIRLRREYFYNPRENAGRYPLDDALGLQNSYTPAMVRLMCRAGARDSYEEGSADLSAYANIDVSAQQINRMVRRIGPGMREELEAEPPEARTPQVPRLYVSCDGTGVPMRRSELVGIKGKGQDGRASTREVKVGSIFTEHPVPGQEEPFRDSDSTSYIATLQRCERFGTLLRKEAYRRGMGRAGEIVFIADGAAWIWEIVRTCFPFAVQILDYYHAHEYLAAIVDLLHGKATAFGKHRLECWKALLFEDKIKEVISQARSLGANLPDSEKEILESKINYLENNQSRMLYGTYKSKGYFYGSGVVEAGCKTLIGKRAKQSGMFWSEKGAEDVLAIRSALYSGRFDDYWDKKNAS